MKNYLLLLLLLHFYSFAQIPNDCSDCSSKIIDEIKIESLDVYALKLLKNEIYARKGYRFTSARYTNHFKKFSWYKPLNDNSTIVFSDLEIKNIAILNQKLNQIQQFISTEQNSKYKTLPEAKIKEIFTSKRKQELGIHFNIWKVYDYQDKTGKFYLVLTEDKYKEPNEGDNFNKAVRAFNFKVENDIWVKTFEINEVKNDYEESIWFWSRYIYVEDFDNDGIVEPIVIYGTRADNGYSDGRIKILLYYKGKKIGIRIQNGILDNERNFSVDAAFYKISKKIQDKIIEQMQFMTTNNHSILPHGWEKKMGKKMVYIEE